ncbi:TetR/AcrR family transcriptional regulator (plasmid) [Sphingomonas paeninsulae]|uniref:TetR/AcrR family transcriptional regulator n=1 Tax=Sphingomonas paeninsulae TaxID=2319844 RepID=A0A494TGW9_SPHPE|nr:TetR family transcriptional regulator [Sphingomonas paeninsulae]AYJ85071.1 TetR/AcrR family transcriptional regulator [Sphingomonas paeninsulae]
MKRLTPEQNQSGQTMGSKGLRTRRKIIDTTVELLATTPLRDLKVVDIAQMANVSAATFYVYFDTVIDVVLAATAELSQSTPEILAIVNAPWDHATGHDRAVEMVESYIRYWDEHRPLMRTRNLAAEEGDERFVGMRERSILPLMLAMVEQIEAAQRDGRVARGFVPYASAGTLLMMLERLGALAHIYNGRGRVTFPQMKIAAAHTVTAGFGWSVIDEVEREETKRAVSN